MQGTARPRQSATSKFVPSHSNGALAGCRHDPPDLPDRSFVPQAKAVTVFNSGGGFFAGEVHGPAVFLMWAAQSAISSRKTVFNRMLRLPTSAVASNSAP